MKKIIYISILAALLCSCSQRFVESWDKLAVDLNKIVLKADKTAMPICIHYNGSWTVEVTDGGDWLSVDPKNGRGVATVHLYFDQNAGLSRKGEVTITADNGDCVVIPVVNSSAIASPTMQFVKKTINPSADKAILSLGVNTNIPTEEFNSIEHVIKFGGEEGEDGEEGEQGEAQEWVHGFLILDREEPVPAEEMPDAVRRFIQLEIDENTTGAARSASLEISLEDAAGKVYSAILNIVQGEEGSYIVLPARDLILKSGGSRKVEISSNLESALEDAEIDIDYGEAQEFISNATISGNILSYDVAENDTEAMRTATITLSVGLISASMEVCQYANDADFTDFIITDASSFEIWASSWDKWKATDNVVLDTDIDVSEMEWTPRVLRGSFDGGNHIIKGLHVTAADTAALFSRMTAGAVLKNLQVGSADSFCSLTVNGSENQLAGIVAYVVGECQIQNVKSYTNVTAKGTASNSYIAGVIARANTKISVEGCVNYGSILMSAKAKYNYFGGIIADFVNGSSGSELRYCENYGEIKLTSVSTTGARFGGIIGSAYGAFEFSDNVNHGKIVNNSSSVVDVRMGGVEGSSTTAAANLARCINYGEVVSMTNGNSKLAKAYIAGVLGYKGAGASKMTDCQAYGDVSADSETGITELYLSGLYGYPSVSGCSITGCKVKCNISGNAATEASTHVGMVAGHTVATTIKTTGLAGSVNEVEIDATNWKNAGVLYGTTTDASKINVSGDSNSCYFMTE